MQVGSNINNNESCAYKQREIDTHNIEILLLLYTNFFSRL